MKSILYITSIFLFSFSFEGHAQTDSAKKNTYTLQHRRSLCRTIVAGKYNRFCKNLPCDETDTLTIAELLSDSVLRPTSNCAECKVTGFEMITTTNGLTETILSHSNRFTWDMIERIKLKKKGDYIGVQDVKISCPDDGMATIEGNYMIIK